MKSMTTVVEQIPSLRFSEHVALVVAKLKHELAAV